MVVCVDAEFDGDVVGCLTISAVTPRHHRLAPGDRHDLVGLLDGEASVEPASQTGGVQRIYTSALYPDRSQSQPQPLLPCIEESGGGTREKHKPKDRQPP